MIRILALALAAVSAFAAWWLAPGCLDIAVWQPLGEAAHLRPPEHLWPGLWRLLAAGTIRVIGLNATVRLLLVLGPLTLGFIAYRVTLAMEECLVLLLRTGRCRTDFRDVIVPILATCGAALFVSSDLVFHAAWSCSPDLLTIALLVVIFDLMRAFFLRASLWCGSLGILLTGVLAADGTFGFVVLAAILVTHLTMRIRDVMQTYVLSVQSLYHVAKWAATGLFLLGFLSVQIPGICKFLSWGGSWSTAFIGYWQGVGSSDVAQLLALVLAPFVLTVLVLPSATNTNRFLSYSTGLLVVAGAVASSVFFFCPTLIQVVCTGAHACFIFAAAFTLIAVLTIVFVEVCCRNHHAIYVEQYRVDPGDVDRDVRLDSRFPPKFRTALPYLMVGYCALIVVCERTSDRGTARMTRELDRCAEAVLAETEGLNRLFSDGSLDELMELKAALRGRLLLTSAFISKDADYARKLRCRGVIGEADVSAMSVGANVALASWLDRSLERPALPLATSAVQMGFELWRRDGRPLPALGGFVGRPDGFAGQPGEAQAAAWSRADDFVRRATDPSAERDRACCHDKQLGERYDKVKFRVARLLELRAMTCDRMGAFEEATRLLEQAKTLDRNNESLDYMRSFMGLVWEQSDLHLTPYEALEVTLKRANYRAAKPHAEAVLSSDPDDYKAHFALGMYYSKSRSFALADVHLTAALEKRPEETTFLNNLAIVRMYRGRLEEALELSDQALARHPEVDEIKATNEEIRRRLSLR